MALMWEMYQQRKIRSAENSSTDAKLKANNVGQSLMMLEDKMDTLALTCQALWELVRDNTKLNENDILDKIEEIDLRDGKKDGKIGSMATTCKKCGRNVSNRHTKCFYCGDETLKEHVFHL